MRNKNKISIVIVSMMMAMSPVAEVLPNVSVQVQAATHHHKKHHKKSRAKIQKVNLWSVNFNNGKLSHITAKKRAHKVIHSTSGTFTFNVLYYVPRDHKWEPASVFKTKAKARAAYKKARAEDRRN